MSDERRRRWAWVLGAVFAFALLMGPGPGLYFANRPVAFLGVPALYAWGLLWYVVELSVILAAFFLVWVDPKPLANKKPSSSSTS